MVSFTLRLGEQVQRRSGDEPLAASVADTLTGYNEVSLGGIATLFILVVVSTVGAAFIDGNVFVSNEGSGGERQQSERDTGELIGYWLEHDPSQLPQGWELSLSAVKSELMRSRAVDLSGLRRRQKKKFARMDLQAIVPNASMRRLRNLENHLGDYPSSIERCPRL